MILFTRDNILSLASSKEKIDDKGAVFLVNKPFEWTSFDVVNKLRYAFKAFLNKKKLKVGHAGTLDPLATGLLIICVGKATKRIHQFQDLPKKYSGSIKLGRTTASYDAEMPEENPVSIDHLTKSQVLSAFAHFQGLQEQIPPMYSAIKKDGKKLYEIARKGKVVEREARKIEIFEFKLKQFDLPLVQFDLHCTKGTYVRSLARDLGEYLKTGGYLRSLQRDAIGEYLVEDALDLNTIIESMKIM